MRHGNTKDDKDKASVFLHMRCKKSDKEKWMKQAEDCNLKLSEFVTQRLNVV